jgi:hypothetical protein
VKPIITTLVMGVVAMATSAAAWYFYPRIETTEEVVREKLLTEEQAFEPRDVRVVRIEQFDRANNNPVEFEFRLESGSWVIPSRNNYPANNTERVAAAVNSLREKEILEVVSDNKDDHEEYGVLELSELGSTGLGAGTVLTWEGRNRKRLGRLIVGTSPEGNESQRYVRLAGQPQIYIVEFDPGVLTTEFADWVDGQLIRVGGDRMPELISHIDVSLYYRDQDGRKKFNYQARIRRSEDNRWLYDLWRPDAEKNIPEQPDLADQPVNLATLGRLVQQLTGFPLQDVARKQETAALDLADPAESQPASHFDALKTRGFYHSGFAMGQHRFDAAAGEITIAFRFGMEVRLYVGSMAGLGVTGGGKINRSLMLTSRVDPSLVPEPEKPGAVSPAAGQPDPAAAETGDETTAEAATDQEPAVSDEEQRQYQAALKQRTDLLETAARESRSFNQVHADWIYVVPDESISNLFPPAESWPAKSN